MKYLILGLLTLASASIHAEKIQGSGIDTTAVSRLLKVVDADTSFTTKGLKSHYINSDAGGLAILASRRLV